MRICMIYFAFGSNMHHEQMKKRCGESRFISMGVLEHYRFVYDGVSDRWGGAVGNIVPSEGELVLGGLFDVSDSDIESLDSYEGYPVRYQKDYFPVLAMDGTTVKAFAYFRESKKIGLPSEPYRESVMQGAKDCGLPEDYIEKYLNRK